MVFVRTSERCPVFAVLPPHIAESLRLSDVLFSRLCGEAEPRRNSFDRCYR
jgi:hypothetical protein